MSQIRKATDDVFGVIPDGIGQAGDAVATTMRKMADHAKKVVTQTKDLDDSLGHGIPDPHARRPDQHRPKGLTGEEYQDLLKRSVHNPDAPYAVLGKFQVEGTFSYVEVAEGKDPPATYFSLGDEWDAVQATTGLDRDGMFEHFNQPFLDKIASEGKEIHFSHNPRDPDFAESSLEFEIDYLVDVKGYEFDEGKLQALPPKAM